MTRTTPTATAELPSHRNSPAGYHRAGKVFRGRLPGMARAGRVSRPCRQDTAATSGYHGLQLATTPADIDRLSRADRFTPVNQIRPSSQTALSQRLVHQTRHPLRLRHDGVGGVTVSAKPGRYRARRHVEEQVGVSNRLFGCVGVVSSRLRGCGFVSAVCRRFHGHRCVKVSSGADARRLPINWVTSHGSSEIAPTRNPALVGQGFFIAVRTRPAGNTVITGTSGTPSGRVRKRRLLRFGQKPPSRDSSVHAQRRLK